MENVITEIALSFLCLKSVMYMCVCAIFMTEECSISMIDPMKIQVKIEDTINSTL